MFNHCVHGAALAVVLALALYRPILVLLVPLLALSYNRAVRTLRLGAAGSVVALRWTANDELTWQRRDGREVRGRLRHATVLGHHAVLLRLSAGQRRFAATPVLLAGDSLAPEVHRRLRARITLWQPARSEIDFFEPVQERLSNLRAAVRRGRR